MIGVHFFVLPMRGGQPQCCEARIFPSRSPYLGNASVTFIDYIGINTVINVIFTELNINYIGFTGYIKSVCPKGWVTGRGFGLRNSEWSLPRWCTKLGRRLGCPPCTDNNPLFLYRKQLYISPCPNWFQLYSRIFLIPLITY